ncbi:hypothetical protein SAMN05444064_13143 [Pseudomonas syringae]|nr:hypothetical protein SAMN05444514_13243 [Pseudomonas syringae]SFM76031.1 hypothetical protein SAMN05444064_13143 [Pseudomonas syringae]
MDFWTQELAPCPAEIQRIVTRLYKLSKSYAAMVSGAYEMQCPRHHFFIENLSCYTLIITQDVLGGRLLLIGGLRSVAVRIDEYTGRLKLIPVVGTYIPLIQR